VRAASRGLSRESHLETAQGGGGDGGSEGCLERAVLREPSQDGMLEMAWVRWPRGGDGVGGGTGDGMGEGHLKTALLGGQAQGSAAQETVWARAISRQPSWEGGLKVVWHGRQHV